MFNNLTSLTLSTSMTTIASSSFAENALTSVSIPPSVETIGNGAFSDNLLSKLVIPGTVDAVDEYAFARNALTSVSFLGDAPTAGNNVFSDNAGLAAVSRVNSATGWSGTWSGVPVVIVDARATATVKPTVGGTAKVGKTLTAAKGTWAGYPTPTFTYQWYACTRAVSAASSTVPATCKKITGATKSTFRLTSAQRGKFVAVLVTGKSLRTAATPWLSVTTTKVK